MTREQARELLLNLQRPLKLSENEREAVKMAIQTLYFVPSVGEEKSPAGPKPAPTPEPS